MNIEKFYQDLDALFAEKKVDKVEAFLLDAIAKAEAAEEHAMIVAACNELGGLYRMLSRYEEGLPLYDKALDSLKRMGESDSENYATTLINYATILSMSGNHEVALEKYKEAVLIMQLHGAESNYRMAALYNNMSGIYRAKGDFNTAVTYIHKAVLILQELSGSDAEIAISYSNLAGLYIVLKDMANAEKYAKEAVGIFRSKVGTQDVHYSAALCTLGEVEFAKGEYNEAVELFSEALQLIARDYGTGTDSYKIVEKNLKLCQEKK